MAGVDRFLMREEGGGEEGGIGRDREGGPGGRRCDGTCLSLRGAQSSCRSFLIDELWWMLFFSEPIVLESLLFLREKRRSWNMRGAGPSEFPFLSCAIHLEARIRSSHSVFGTDAC